MKIKKIDLSNVRCFRKFSLNIKDYNKENTSILVILGDNGIGKSTILKSIVHCLSVYNHVYGGELFDETDISNGEERCLIDLELEFNPKEQKFLFENDDINSDKLKSVSHVIVGKQKVDGNLVDIIYTLLQTSDEYNRFRNKFISPNFDGGYIFYFDAFRYLPRFEIEGPNTALIPSNKKENILASSIIDYKTVNQKFLYVKQWLVNLDFKRLKNPSPENEFVFQHIINSFNNLFSPYRFSKITDDGQVLFENKEDIVSLDKLSDGFKNIFIVIGEIFYRLYLSENENIRFFEKEAIILIDEIDCHLHPKWQVNLISSLKMLFPNCQIIATTHSPFILTNLKENEIYRLGD